MRLTNAIPREKENENKKRDSLGISLLNEKVIKSDCNKKRKRVIDFRKIGGVENIFLSDTANTPKPQILLY